MNLNQRDNRAQIKKKKFSNSLHKAIFPFINFIGEITILDRSSPYVTVDMVIRSPCLLLASLLPCLDKRNLLIGKTNGLFHVLYFSLWAKMNFLSCFPWHYTVDYHLTEDACLQFSLLVKRTVCCHMYYMLFGDWNICLKNDQRFPFPL